MRVDKRRENPYAYALGNPIRIFDSLGLFAQLYCREVYGAGEPNWKKTVIDLYKPLHCRLRLRCGCGTPDVWDLTVGREIKNGGYPVTVEPFSQAAYGPPWFSTPVDGSGPNCEFEKCALSTAEAQSNNPNLVGPYDPVLGPNSNTWVKDVLEKCAGKTTFPDKAWGAH